MAVGTPATDPLAPSTNCCLCGSAVAPRVPFDCGGPPGFTLANTLHATRIAATGDCGCLPANITLTNPHDSVVHWTSGTLAFTDCGCDPTAGGWPFNGLEFGCSALLHTPSGGALACAGAAHGTTPTSTTVVSWVPFVVDAVYDIDIVPGLPLPCTGSVTYRITE